MSRTVWKRVLRKELGGAELWRAILIIEDHPSLFRVVEDEEALNHLKIKGNFVSVQPVKTGVVETTVESYEAALEYAKAFFKQCGAEGWSVVSAHSEG